MAGRNGDGEEMRKDCVLDKVELQQLPLKAGAANKAALPQMQKYF